MKKQVGSENLGEFIKEIEITGVGSSDIPGDDFFNFTIKGMKTRATTEGVID